MYVGFWVPTAVVMENFVFWDIMSCSPLKIFWDVMPCSLVDIYCGTLKMEAVGSSES
jgi:hypothetical protein